MSKTLVRLARVLATNLLGDIYSFLIEPPGPFTHERLKAFKSLEANDYFVSRKVGPIFSAKQKAVIVLKAS